MSDAQPSRLLILAVAVPPILATMALAAFSLLDVAGRTPLSYGPTRNIAEAAALGNGAEVTRLLAAGDDPARLMAVRPEVISSSVTRVTALEAAVWSRSDALARLLDSRGTIGDDAIRRHLVCLARDTQAGNVADVFAAGAVVVCEPGAALRAVTGRS